MLFLKDVGFLSAGKVLANLPSPQEFFFFFNPFTLKSFFCREILVVDRTFLCVLKQGGGIKGAEDFLICIYFYFFIWIQNCSSAWVNRGEFLFPVLVIDCKKDTQTTNTLSVGMAFVCASVIGNADPCRRLKTSTPTFINEPPPPHTHTPPLQLASDAQV